VHDAVELIEPTSGRLVDGGVATIIQVEGSRSSRSSVVQTKRASRHSSSLDGEIISIGCVFVSFQLELKFDPGDPPDNDVSCSTSISNSTRLGGASVTESLAKEIVSSLLDSNNVFRAFFY